MRTCVRMTWRSPDQERKHLLGVLERCYLGGDADLAIATARRAGGLDTKDGIRLASFLAACEHPDAERAVVRAAARIMIEQRLELEGARLMLAEAARLPASDALVRMLGWLSFGREPGTWPPREKLMSEEELWAVEAAEYGAGSGPRAGEGDTGDTPPGDPE